jgi:hypothetical protein
VGRQWIVPAKGVDALWQVLEADGAAAGWNCYLKLTATPLVDAPDLQIEWIVPEGVELLGRKRAPVM